MNIPDGILCAKTHEYIINCGEYALIGISDILLSKLGDIIFIELPEVGAEYSKKEVFATIEGDGVAAELYMPVAGKILATNPLFFDSYSSINTEPLSDGWIIKIEPSDYFSDIDELTEYYEYVKENDMEIK